MLIRLSNKSTQMTQDGCGYVSQSTGSVVADSVSSYAITTILCYYSVEQVILMLPSTPTLQSHDNSSIAGSSPAHPSLHPIVTCRSCVVVAISWRYWIRATTHSGDSTQMMVHQLVILY